MGAREDFLHGLRVAEQTIRDARAIGLLPTPSTAAPAEVREAAKPPPPAQVAAFESDVLDALLQLPLGERSATGTAAQMGMTRQNLHKKMRHLGLEKHFAELRFRLLSKLATESDKR